MSCKNTRNQLQNVNATSAIWEEENFESLLNDPVVQATDTVIEIAMKSKMDLKTLLDETNLRNFLQSVPDDSAARLARDENAISRLQAFLYLFAQKVENLA